MEDHPFRADAEGLHQDQELVRHVGWNHDVDTGLREQRQDPEFGKALQDPHAKVSGGGIRQ